MRRDLEYFIIIFTLITLAMYGLIRMGTTLEDGLFCDTCPNDNPFNNYGDYKEKVVRYLIYIPLFIYKRMHLTFSSNPDINYAIGMMLSFFIFFGAIALTYWLLRRLLMLIVKDEPTAQDNR